MSKHTQGPWTAKGPDIVASDGTRIASCGITRNYADNAKLIAAAPDLLDALKAIKENTWWCCLPDEIRNQAWEAMYNAGVRHDLTK